MLHTHIYYIYIYHLLYNTVQHAFKRREWGSLAPIGRQGRGRKYYGFGCWLDVEGLPVPSLAKAQCIDPGAAQSYPNVTQQYSRLEWLDGYARCQDANAIIWIIWIIIIKYNMIFQSISYIISAWGCVCVCVCVWSCMIMSHASLSSHVLNFPYLQAEGQLTNSRSHLSSAVCQPHQKNRNSNNRNKQFEVHSKPPSLHCLPAMLCHGTSYHSKQWSLGRNVLCTRKAANLCHGCHGNIFWGALRIPNDTSPRPSTRKVIL